MLLYHGSNIAVREPKILKSQRYLDFGAGFYMTSDFEQARKWAVRTAARREEGVATKDVAIKLLLPQKLKDQYLFRTERALKLLTFKEAKQL